MVDEEMTWRECDICIAVVAAVVVAAVVAAAVVVAHTENVAVSFCEKFLPRALSA